MEMITTPFGRRPMTLGQIATRLRIERSVEDAGKPGSNAPDAVDKWRICRVLTEIRERLGVSDRALSVLNALLSFHPETALTLPKPRAAQGSHSDENGEGASSSRDPASCDLIVFPSNRALARRAHGMAPATLWRHLTALVQVGLIARRDSPNGKRYARKDASGQERFSDAFGFDLTPLVARATEFEALAEDERAARKQRALAKERISLLRRDVTKSIALGLDENLPGDWEGRRRRAMALMMPLRSLRCDDDLAALLSALVELRDDVAKALESCVDVLETRSNDHQNEAHQSTSNTQDHPDLEPASKEQGGGEVEPEAASTRIRSADELAAVAEPYPLAMVMEACPDVADYAPDGRVKSWSAFLAAAGAVRPMIGISPDAWREAQAALGRVEAHVVVATILQRSIHSSEAEFAPGSTTATVNGSPAIQSAGGYLRALTEKARAGEFALGPVLMALIGQRLKTKRAAANKAALRS